MLMFSSLSMISLSPEACRIFSSKFNKDAPQCLFFSIHCAEFYFFGNSLFFSLFEDNNNSFEIFFCLLSYCFFFGVFVFCLLGPHSFLLRGFPGFSILIQNRGKAGWKLCGSVTGDRLVFSLGIQQNTQMSVSGGPFFRLFIFSRILQCLA